MKYTTEAEMRSDLAKVVKDPDLIDATIKQYFAKNPVPKARPKPVRPPRVYTPTTVAPWGSHSEDGLAEQKMREGSQKLGDAIEAMLAGRKFTTPDKLLWSQGIQPGQWAKDANTTAREREARSLQKVMDRNHRVQARVVESGSPCFRCGAARGCSPTRCGPVNVTPKRVNHQWDKEAGYG